jgi:hypothetical protein
MKGKSSRMAEVQLKHPRHPRTGPPPFSIPPGSGASGGSAAFTVRLPEGATVAVPAGFDPDEVFALLTVVREALR